MQSALYLKKRRMSVAQWRKASGNPLFELGDYRYAMDLLAKGKI